MGLAISTDDIKHMGDELRASIDHLQQTVVAPLLAEVEALRGEIVALRGELDRGITIQFGKKEIT